MKSINTLTGSPVEIVETFQRIKAETHATLDALHKIVGAHLDFDYPELSPEEWPEIVADYVARVGYDQACTIIASLIFRVSWCGFDYGYDNWAITHPLVWDMRSIYLLDIGSDLIDPEMLACLAAALVDYGNARDILQRKPVRKFKLFSLIG